MTIPERFNQFYRRHLVATEPYNEHSPLDIYIDKRQRVETRKIIIFWYGGSWLRGRKELYRFVADFLARVSGAVVLVPDYQKYPIATMPLFIDEAWNVVEWATNNAEKYGATMDGYSVIGHSAGGHTAAMVALAARKPSKLPLPAKCIDLAAPNRSVGEAYEKVFGDMRTNGSGFPVSVTKKLSTPSPVEFLLIHGRLDRIVWQSQHNDLVKALQANGATLKSLRPWAGHISLILATGSPLGAYTATGRTIKKFLRGNDMMNL